MATISTPAEISRGHAAGMDRPGRISVLDGWRGIAILLVLFEHIQSAQMGGILKPWTATGQHGVTIFFVLSGFLITSKLIDGRISPGQFYIRRFFRLMPAAWAYLAFLWTFDFLLGHPLIGIRETASCVFFYRNYLGNTGSMVASHFWSLSMEEQFYIVWPCLLLLVGIRKVRWFAVGGALGLAFYRLVRWNYYNRLDFNYRTEVRADAILVGCLLALLFSNPKIRAAATRWAKFCAAPALAILFFCFARFRLLPPLYEDLSIAILIAASLLYPRAALSRLLSNPAIVWLGTVSYSIYIWQQFFMGLPAGYTGLGLLIIGLPLCVLGSYYCIELPCVRLGHRLARSRTSLVTHESLRDDRRQLPIVV
jgi:peptidoglycan/LPS O-acetylase OafA/YrhL